MPTKYSTFEPDPNTRFAWQEIWFRGVRLRVRVALGPTGNVEIIDFIPPPNTAWGWDFIDKHSNEILMNLQF